MFVCYVMLMYAMSCTQFDFGPDTLITRQSESTFHWYGSNVHDTRQGADALLGTTRTQHIYMFRVTRDGVTGAVTTERVEEEEMAEHVEDEHHTILRVGMIGVCTAHTPHLSYPGPHITFAPVIPHTRHLVASLRPHVDILIALTHLSLREWLMLMLLSPHVVIAM